MDLIVSVQEGVKYRDFINTVFNLLISQNVDNLLTR
jgi:hypothetical protein